MFSKWGLDMRYRRFPPWFRPASFFLVAAISTAAYLVVSRLGGFLGFALDDAWIHQTYARNLAQGFQFAFVPGQPSAGSTSPLWTLLVAVGYLIHVPYLAWTFHMRCPPNLLVDNSAGGCGDGMALAPTEWGRALMDRFAVAW